MTIVTVWVLCALLPDLIAPYDPLDFRTGLNESPSWSHPFGTDRGGRDVLSRVIAGARDVLKIAPVAAILGVIVGVILGLLMGYLRGWFDTVASRVVESFLSLPVVLLGLLAVTTLGNSNWVVIGIVADALHAGRGPHRPLCGAGGDRARLRGLRQAAAANRRRSSCSVRSCRTCRARSSSS